MNKKKNPVSVKNVIDKILLNKKTQQWSFRNKN